MPPKIALKLKVTAPLLDPALVLVPVDEATVAVLEALDKIDTLAGKLLKLPVAVELAPVAVRVTWPPETEPVPMVMGMFSTEPVSVIKVVERGSMTASVQVAWLSAPMPQRTETETVAPSVTSTAASEMMEGPWRKVTGLQGGISWVDN